ncbi:Golgi membrane exchange factor (Ric1p-Rgp1p) subunit [Conoideocrella luteorostrata]|uniref:Golgi membrane exchange factor (Ric1p-Rgp1p) subunit n=1 Tax=Conoideocrella luteorostrata TaxID=1105319 RepID=A0AAJ0CIR8_9HYPO|nr:Golgi membrane exchange factor (Ric1p-Rgp1p) subunit [Conoideocrella luteorostrata]
MPPESPSTIRVFIQWRDQTVFAGEEVKATITFKNIASTSDQSRQQRSQQQQKLQGERQRLTVPLQARATKGNVGLTSPPSTNATRGHRRSALSLSVSTAHSHSRSGSVQWPHTAGSGGDWRPGHNHKRSLSIVSIGSTNTAEEHAQRSEPQLRSQRPHGRHNRAASLQIPSHGVTSPGAGPQSAPFFGRHTSSPLFNASYPPDQVGRFPGAASVPNTPGPSGQRRSPKSPAGQQMPDFRFPAAQLPPDNEANGSSNTNPSSGLLSSRRTNPPDKNNLTVRSKEQPLSAIERPAARILASNTAPGGTPRSSGEFYPMSNNSSETLVSEYVTQPLARGNGRPPHLRRSSGMTPQQQKAPESLMMGYAQIQGTFALDGSLVSLGQFEQVKKKGAVGGRGGGVVGLEPTKRENGLLRGLGWGNISNSLGDLLGGKELSTIKEMRGAANSKSIPLLSTPQSILFVDLQLAPGESRSYEYTFCLPKGLPPSHKGKTIKISYSLVIGTQRAGGAKEQQVRSIEIPFRVLGSVNSHGEILGHDLMNPYILLRDMAEVKSLGKHTRSHKPRASFGPPATMNEFLSYVDDLGTRPRGSPGAALLSPTGVNPQRRPSAYEEATTAREAIHLAIMRSNMAGDGQQSANRFEIARNGQRVGVVMLTRPAYRLGEVVTMAIDFTDADIPCYAVHATLETSETVDTSLAVRSESSLQRVTRKIYVASSEATMYSRRVVFTPTIPISATPEFVTSGINLEWKIRIEFVVPYQGSDASNPDGLPVPHPLLEQISQDEKGGLVLVAMENLACESFDVSVPLRVYGAVGNGLERLERDEASEEGLAV